MRVVNFAGHLGLGDAIVLSGAAVYLSHFHDLLRVFCWRKYLQNVKSFYVNHPRIEVIPIDSEHELLDAAADHVIRTGFYRTDIPPGKEESWDRWFYRQMGLPIEIRWTHCPIQNAYEQFPQIDWPLNVSLVHDDVDRHYEIRQLPERFLRVRNNTQTILSYCSALIAAPQKHVIDSSMFHVIESLSPSGQLFLHRYAKPFKPHWCECATRHDWIIIE